MITELLGIRMAPEDRERYVQQEHDIWTAYIAKQPGFLWKEIWLNPEDDGEVILVIHWTTLAEQQAVPKQAVPKAELAAVEQQFKLSFGTAYEVVEVKLYQVRKTVSGR